MKKKRLIALTMCLMLSASVGIMTSCGGDNSTSNAGSSVESNSSVAPGASTDDNSSSDSSAETPIVVEYKVTFNSKGGSDVAPQIVKNGAKASKPEDPTRDGYTFVEWQLNGNTYNFDTRVTGNITLTAKWEKTPPVKYTVTFVSEGVTVSTVEVEVGKKLTKPATDPTREGFAFDCWTLNGEAYDFETPVTQAITLEAKWADLWTVTFDVGEADPFSTTTVANGKNATAPIDIPAREGFVFECWTLNGEAYDFETPVTQPITLVAQWANAWKVTFDVGDGTAVEYVMVKNGNMISAPETIRYGYYVSGWLLNGEDFDFNTPITGDITLTAVWEREAWFYNNQIGARICGNDVSGNESYITATTNDNGATVITAKFQADATYSPALILKNLAEKSEYESMIAEGKEVLTFNLAVEGDVTDLYVFGKALNTFPEENDVYAISIKLQQIVYYYDTMYKLATSATQAGQATSLAAKFISWKSPDGDYKSVRNYVFTITNTAFAALPTLSVDFAADNVGTIEVGKTTTLLATSNTDGAIVWSSSDESIATVVDGVVTGVKAGEVVITATLGELTASKTVYVKAPAITYNNQIGARIHGNDVSANQSYVKVTTDDNATVITAKFQADATYSPALIVRKLAEKSVYEAMIAEGKEVLTFNLAVEGDVTDLYVFGKALNTFPEENGVYSISIKLQQIVYYYDTMHTIATSAAQVGEASSIAAKFITWKSPADDWSTVRNYVFTITNTAFAALPTLSVDFAADNVNTIEVGKTTTLLATSNTDGAIVWSSSDENIATVVDGVVTGVKAGEVVITATLGELTASKTVYVKAPAITYNNQIGARICGNDVSANQSYVKVTTDNNATVITAKFQADGLYSPALIVRKLAEKSVYEAMIAEGKEVLTFNLAVEGDVTDLYVFGKALSTFPETNGVYSISIKLQHMTVYYDTMYTLATSDKQVGQASSLAAKFISWKSPDGDYTSVRNYVFTITNTAFAALPTLSVDFAADNVGTIEVGKTTTLLATSNTDGTIVWSSSDESIATVVDGVVTGVKAGEVVITATLGDLTASKTVYVKAPAITYNNQIGARICGNDVSANQSYVKVTTDNNATVITAMFQADGKYSPALIVRKLAEKSVYEAMIAEGKEVLTFNLAVEGDVTDLYVFGKALNTFPETNGVYSISIKLQHMTVYYDTMYTLATSATQAGQATSLAAKFISWKSPDGDYTSVRDYVFTITNTAFAALTSENIAARINGWKMTNHETHCNITTGANGEMVIASAFQANATYAPALVYTNLKDKAYYENLIAKGYTKFTFSLKVEGDVTDLYVFGKALNTFTEEDGVYQIVIDTKQFVSYYDTMYTIATSGSQVGQASSLAAKFICWKSPEGDYTSVRNYVFTISGTAFIAAE